MNNSHAPWKWTRRFSVGLTISVALFAAWGALAPHISWASEKAPIATGFLMAALYGNAQGLANCMAANARRAFGRGAGYSLPAAFFTLCFLGFALLSMSGLHSAWEYAQAHADSAPLPADWLMRWLFFFVAFSEPAMNYGIEALKALQRADDQIDDRAAQEAAAEREVRQRDAEARRKAHYAVVAPAAAAAMVVATAPDLAIGRANQPRESQIDRGYQASPSDVLAEGNRARGWKGPRSRTNWERFVEAHQLGLAPIEIIQRTGLPSTTVYRWRKKMAESPMGAGVVAAGGTDDADDG